ncbi:MAG TPA: DinB family protein [Bryobacteraceae bacterium]|jgi:uncharacterized damage-inducible protein DinB|nr:DinB family protein [Bryobacteraceae bacterium]
MKTLLLGILALSIPLAAQSGEKETLVRHWKTTGEFTVAVAEAMPADGYNFRPVPAEMSFGELMAHIASADLNACANASGLERPPLPPELAAWAKDSGKVDVSRDAALSFLHQTFDFCDKAVAGVTEDQLDKLAGPAQRHLTGREWLWSYFTHTAHHRGQAEVYLRLKGITPPGYRF